MSNKSTISDLDEVWKLVRETQKNLRDLSVRQKEFQVYQEAREKAREKERQAREKERQAQQKEWQARQEAWEKRAEKRAKEAEKEMKRFQAQQEKTDRMIQKVGGRFNKRWGHLVESLVKGKLVPLLKSRGVKVERLFTNAETGDKNGDLPNTEFDIVAVNGTEVVVVEVKTTLTPKDLSRFLLHLGNFKTYFPEYENKALYGAMAYLKSEGKAEVLSEEEGLFVIKAVGDSASLINKPNFKPKAFA